MMKYDRSRTDWRHNAHGGNPIFEVKASVVVLVVSTFQMSVSPMSSGLKVTDRPVVRVAAFHMLAKTVCPVRVRRQ
jgi:hypothetical protein